MAGPPQHPNRLVDRFSNRLECGLPPLCLASDSTPATAELSVVPWFITTSARFPSSTFFLSLSTHHLYNCAIYLLPGTLLPSSQLYNLSRPEQEAIEKYISELLVSGLVGHTSSPVGDGFFFVKKDGSLRPCIEYQGLNEITMRNKYPLPLLDAAFVPLQ